MTRLLSDGIGPIVVGGLVALAVAVLLVQLVNLRVSVKKGNRLDSVLASYSRAVGAGESAAIGTPSKRAGFEPWDKFIRGINEKLAAAGIEVAGQTWVTGSLAASVLLAVLAGAFFQSVVLGVLIGGILGFYLLNAYLGGRIKSRAIKFADDLPSVLSLVASGLRAGLTFPSAMTATATQDPGEAGRQFRRALAEVQFGSSMEDALRRVAARMSSADLAWLVLALEIQREVGGSLSGILDGVAATIKARAEVQREIRVISAEGRMSGYILIALPLFSFVALTVLRPAYVQFFWTDPIGFVLLGVFVVLLAIGWVWMSKVVEVRV